MTNLYEIALPNAPRVGSGVTGNYGASRAEWCELALARAGGYTEMGPKKGAWIDDNTGLSYKEVMHGYRVACSPKIMGELVQAAFDLFPDQLAIFYAVIGRAVIMPRHENIAAHLHDLGRGLDIAVFQPCRPDGQRDHDEKWS